MKFFLLFFVFIIFSKFLFAQTIKKYTGELTNDGKFGQHGSVEYSYYEDSITHDYIKHGQFKYDFVGTSDYKGFKQTITGKFEKGIKVGKWVYTINKTDYKDGYEGKFYTGIVSLVADYKNGYANGKWHYFSNLKFRSQIIKYPGFIWSEYTNLGNDTVIANFKNNHVINKVHIFDKYNNFYADAYFDSNSMCDSNWKIQDNILESITEIKFNSGFRTEAVARRINDLKVEEVLNNIIYFERLKYYNSIDVNNTERLKCKIDTISTIGSQNYFDIYFKRLLSDDNFLYKSIGGDNSFLEKFKGSYEVLFKEYYSLKNINGFLENYNNYYTEDSAYKIFKTYNKNIDDFMPSERDLLNNFLKKMENVHRLGNLKNFNSSRFKNDSLAMCLIWNTSDMSYDRLNKEDKVLIGNLNKLFKDTIEKSKNFSKQLDQCTRQLFSSYSEFLVKNKFYDPLNWNTESVYNCFYKKDLFVQVINNNTRPKTYYLVPLKDSISFNLTLNQCVVDTSLYNSTLIGIIKDYFATYNLINKTHELVNKFSNVDNSKKIYIPSQDDPISKYTFKFYDYFYLGELNNYLLEINNKLTEFKKIVSDNLPPLKVIESPTWR
jgi:hypothetical protein